MTDQIMSGTSNLPTQPKLCPLTLAPYIFISIGHLKYLNIQNGHELHKQKNTHNLLQTRFKLNIHKINDINM